MTAIPAADRARAAALKDQLCACDTIAEVNACVRSIAPEVAALAVDQPMLAADVRNFAAYARLYINNGWWADASCRQPRKHEVDAA